MLNYAHSERVSRRWLRWSAQRYLAHLSFESSGPDLGRGSGEIVQTSRFLPIFYHHRSFMRMTQTLHFTAWHLYRWNKTRRISG